MKERVNFVLEWERRWEEARGGPVDMAELCRKYGVSRPEVEDWIVQARKAMPRRGPRKLRASAAVSAASVRHASELLR